MGFRRARSVFFAAAPVALGIACSLDGSVIVPADGVDASTIGDASATGDASVGDAGEISDGQVTFDSGGDATVGTTECSALTLCDDAGPCGGGQACVPPITAGWTLVGFDAPSQNGPCGASYTAHSGFDLTDGGPAQCSCSCTAGTPPSCTNIQAVLTTGAACDMGATTENVTGACSGLPGVGFSPTNGGAILAHLQAMPDSCSASSGKSNPSWDGGAAVQCTFGGDGGEFCAGHATCVVASSASHRTCIAHTYDGGLSVSCAASCPASFASSCYVTADNAVDTRDCSACACDWNNLGCNSPTVTVSAQGNCGGTTTTISPDTCASTTIPTLGGMFVTGSAATPTCGKTSDSAPTGGVAPSGVSVVCCAD